MDKTNNTAGEALDLNKSRAEFEAWMRKTSQFAIFRRVDGDYRYESMETEWAHRAWSAALARAGSEAPTAPTCPACKGRGYTDAGDPETGATKLDYPCTECAAPTAAQKEGATEQDALKAAIVASLNNWETEMEGYSYFCSNPGVKRDDYEDIADEVVAAMSAAQAQPKDTTKGSEQ